MRNWMAAFDTLYGVSAYIGKHSTAGETDRQVAPATFRAVLHRDPSDNELARLHAQYLLHLADNVVVPPGYRPFPGVKNVLLRQQRPGVTLELVSETMEGSAQTKFAPATQNSFVLLVGL
jgi:phosphoglycolate phosphatase